jgi:hypothetical protein
MDDYVFFSEVHHFLNIAAANQKKMMVTLW